ncbi:hypothetical protein C8R44DRAFT_874355 [Mycena epipterygia]|nr:hypothetical protein C8R44DRAFT_874355 [Mycena epipterygia]
MHTASRAPYVIPLVPHAQLPTRPRPQTALGPIHRAVVPPKSLHSMGLAVDPVCASAPRARSLLLLLHSSHVPPLHLPSFSAVCAVASMCGPHFAHPFFTYARPAAPAFVRQ